LYNARDIAQNIKILAKRKNIILRDMFVECKLNSNTLSHMYHGKSLASDRLAKIADYLDVSVDYLLGRTNNMNSHKK